MFFKVQTGSNTRKNSDNYFVKVLKCSRLFIKYRRISEILLLIQKYSCYYLEAKRLSNWLCGNYQLPLVFMKSTSLVIILWIQISIIMYSKLGGHGAFNDGYPICTIVYERVLMMTPGVRDVLGVNYSHCGCGTKCNTNLPWKKCYIVLLSWLPIE